MVIAALAMTALLLFAALAIDVGAVWSSRTQSQNAGRCRRARCGRDDDRSRASTTRRTVDLDAARSPQGAVYAAS